MAYTNRGSLANNGMTVMKLDPKVYIVGAHALGTVRATTTVRKFPKPPAEERTACTRPPTLLPCSNPAFHDGLWNAEAANAAPR